MIFSKKIISDNIRICIKIKSLILNSNLTIKLKTMRFIVIKLELIVMKMFFHQDNKVF